MPETRYRIIHPPQAIPPRDTTSRRPRAELFQAAQTVDRLVASTTIVGAVRWRRTGWCPGFACFPFGASQCVVSPGESPSYGDSWRLFATPHATAHGRRTDDAASVSTLWPRWTVVGITKPLADKALRPTARSPAANFTGTSGRSWPRLLSRFRGTPQRQWAFRSASLRGCSA